jgi:transposase-like protein
LTCIKLFSAIGHYGFTMTICPTCPYCTRTMILVHQPDARRSRRDVYECDHCGAVFSEAPPLSAPAIDRAMVLNFGAPAIQH